jgi:acyl-CoA thioester hydrolase
MGHVNHSRYLTYFEDGRFALLSDSPSAVAGGPGDRGYIAARVAVDYLYPVEFRPGLELEVHTWVGRVGTTSWTFLAEMLDGDQTVARSETVMVAYSYVDRRKRPLDDDERAYFERYVPA